MKFRWLVDFKHRNHTLMVLGVISAVLIHFAPSASAHQQALDKVIGLTEKIKNEPKNYSLYLQRGYSYEVNQHYAEAESDYNFASKLDPQNPTVDFYRGRMKYNAGEASTAYPFLDRFIKANPEHEEALLLRARTARQLKKYTHALIDYDDVIYYSLRKLPEWYIEKADILIVINKADDALRALDDGKKELGDLVTFQTKAIDIELALKRYDAALSRVDGLLAQINRKDT